MDLVLEEDFLDLLGQLSHKAPLHEIWQHTGTMSPTGSSTELAVTDLQVRHVQHVWAACPGSSGGAVTSCNLVVPV